MKLSDLQKHITRYGTEGVMDTAVEHHLLLGRFSLTELVELQKLVDEAEAKKRTPWQRGPRGTAEQRVKKLLGLEEEAA